MTTPLEGCYARSADAALTPVGDRVVLYHRKTRTALVLNPTGAWLWRRLDAPRTLPELTTALRQQFPAVAADAAGRDVSAFLHELLQHAFVAPCP